MKPPHNLLFLSNAPLLLQWHTGTNVTFSIYLLLFGSYIIFVYVQSIYINLQLFGNTSFDYSPAMNIVFLFLLYNLFNAYSSK